MPSSRSGTSRPTTARAVIASMPMVWGIQNEANPDAAAPRAASISLSIGPLEASPR